jgi:hypothetical protein
MYAAMEDFLLPAGVSHQQRVRAMERIHRAGDPGAPRKFDLVLYDSGMPCPAQCIPFDPAVPQSAIHEILRVREDLSVPLARMFPAFRKPVVDQVVHAVSRENAMFAVATALPNIVPSFIELPWAVSEFASDTVFLTLNQIRMAFLIAAACDCPIGLSEQKVQVASIVGGAFGWRTLARELAGKLPLGAGLIPKGAIAYAGTYVVGKGLTHLHRVGRWPAPAERAAAYSEGLEKGRTIVKGELAPPAA